MTLLRISVPVYRKNYWNNLEKDGKIEVCSDVDNLSEGYQSLKIEIDKLLLDINAENCLAKEVQELQREIENKSSTLKSLLKDIEKVAEHYENLKLFLEKLGVDPMAHRLTFDRRFLLQDASLSAIEVIGNSSEF